ncbi:hypothetical protein FOMPIDRAFT_1063010 [Fomitopsis schrenkii]|uniref:Uncharacterized protein n=1 Tax=Fomitopsis schrenkii TaxID=2126942 RepID=S8DN55_FOMSC|nr:hypothetical protein FOMPIDRAFT_1063010 [Fomitopsis schrenkii]
MDAEERDGKVCIRAEDSMRGQDSPVDAGVVLVAVGRVAVTSSLRLENNCGVRCFGDAALGPMLTPKAEEEGIAAVVYIKTSHDLLSYHAISSVV